MSKLGPNRKLNLPRCGEGGVNDALFRLVGGALYLVVVEGKFAGQGAIETRLAEGRPRVLHVHRAAGIVFANSSDPRVNSLNKTYIMVNEFRTGNESALFRLHFLPFRN